MADTEIGRLEMRKPGVGKSWITVSKLETGEVDIHMSRSSEGEVLVRLPRGTARQLGELLQKATD